MAKFSKLIGTRAKPGRLVEYEVAGEKVKLELREPSKATQAQIFIASGIRPGESGKKQIPDIERFVANTLLRCAFDPASGERAFDPKDLKNLRNLGPEHDALTEAALDMMRVKGREEEPGKESGPTPS